jgi:hypothetical protein
MSLGEARKTIKKALASDRLVIDMQTLLPVAEVADVMPTGIYKILPIVGGG